MQDKKLLIERLEYLIDVIKDEKTSVLKTEYEWKRENASTMVGYINFPSTAEINLKILLSNKKWKTTIKIGSNLDEK